MKVPSPAAMIQLTDDLYLGRGRTRECFVDPRDPSRCIKVDFADRGFKQTAKEALYYQKLGRLKPELVYDFVPQFHGMVETSRGTGGVFDLVRDADGAVSLPLVRYLRDGTIARERPVWEKALDRFLARLMETGVIVRDLNPGNLCARRLADGSIELVAIDGIGHRDFIPLCDYFLRLARRKLRKYVAKRGMGSIQDLLERAERMARKRAAQSPSLAGISP